MGRRCVALISFLFISLFSYSLSDQLLFLQAAWRHGDRTPTTTCKGDTHQEDAWDKFGGWGQLTPIGMQQHVLLGDLIYREYAETGFLNKKYRPTEMYVRSTDLNRTMVSAMSNMIGMYYERGNAVNGTDFPSAGKWPLNYVPIPIHTVINHDDYVGNPDAVCPRQDWIWSEAEKTQEMHDMRNKSKSIMEVVNTACNETVSLIDMWEIKDAFLIEQVYGMSLIVSDDQYAQMVKINAELEDMQNGLRMASYNGLNFTTEIGKIRGGSMLWDIISHVDLKIHCLDAAIAGESSCMWMKNLRYYAYSVHDTTVGALLAVLGAKPKVVQNGGYPAYASAVLTELWNTTNGLCLQFKFHRNFSEDGFENITRFVTGCEEYDCCPYTHFRDTAKAFYPGDERKLCEDTTSRSTYFDPDAPTTQQSPTTTQQPSTDGSSSRIQHSLTVVLTAVVLLLFGIRTA